MSVPPNQEPPEHEPPELEPPTRGWYDDPSGEPGLYAFWDGRQWGERSRTPPEGPVLPLRAPGTERHGIDPPPIGWILAVAIVIFVVSAVILALTR